MKSLPDTPKVSIITMTYNDCAHLEKCVTQILKQDYENIEYIIVDGGSSDGTHEIIQKAAQQLGDKLKWVSEPDEGLYDALNKGMCCPIWYGRCRGTEQTAYTVILTTWRTVK